jgi:acyl dehydratase
MAITPETLLNWPFEPIEQTYTARDTMLYALGVGLGADPTDLQQIPFVYEANLQALPTMCVVLGTPGFWIKDPATGITWQKVLHGEQGFVLHKPLPTAGTVVAITRVKDLVDKGEGKGALVYVERDIREKGSGDRLATLTSTYFCRADGGFGQSTTTAPKPTPIPEREADVVCELTLDKRAGLIYRLSGDYNPIHVDPKAATAAGFPAPIFHGLGSLGVAGHAVLRAVCDYQPERLTGMTLRFTSPVYPGETLRTEIWREGDRALFRCTVVERNVVALDNGVATLKASA